MPGIFIPPHQQQTSQGSGGSTFHHIAGMFWPQGDPAGLRRAAQAWRDVAQAIDGVSQASSGAAAGVQAQNQGAAIDAFGSYWSKWQGGGGYFEATAQAARQMADGLEKYASAIDSARRRVEELAAAAATVIGVGLVLTFVTFGISDAAAGATAAGLTAAAAAVGVELSATVAGIVATVLTGAAIGAVASMTIDTAIQIERIYGFQDQKGFNWSEFEHSAELGALTGGAGSAIALGARALGPILEDGLPAFSKLSDAWGSLPNSAQMGIRGVLVGGGLSAGVDELTTGKVSPFDVALGAASGVTGEVAGSRYARPPVDPVNGYAIQERDLNFLGLSREQAGWWGRREAPLGMTPGQFSDFRTSLDDALRQDGVSPDHVDVRLHGSSANFFSSARKPFPTEQSIADNPEALARLRAWFGSDTSRPALRPFDSMYRLGLDTKPSDYDINLSSSQMVELAHQKWVDLGSPGDFFKPGAHGYLTKSVAEAAFPHVQAWADRWSAILGREVSHAVFPGTGPLNTTATDGVSVHFQRTDWIIHRVPVP